MIVSASRRTDIPRFFAEWFMNRIKGGYCLVPNPYNAKQISRISLTAGDVTALVFWTRFPGQLLDFLPDLDERGYKYYFQYTLTGYGRQIEKNAPPVEQAIDCFKKVSSHVGAERIIWRYDPILFTKGMGTSFHLDNFGRLAKALGGKSLKVVISFMDEYRRTLSAFSREGVEYDGDPLRRPDLCNFLEQLDRLAVSNGFSVETCAESADFSSLGIEHGHCVDERLIGQLTGRCLVYKKDPSQRQACGCMVSRDIGVNNTCPGGCIYCYATHSSKIDCSIHDKSFPAMVK
jgi:hypothetical protein